MFIGSLYGQQGKIIHIDKRSTLTEWITSGKLEIGGGIYNYKKVNGTWARAFSKIEIWEVSSQFGNTTGRWKGNLQVEFSDSSTGWVVIFNRDGSIVKQRFKGIANMNKATKVKILEPNIVAHTPILLSGNTIVYEGIYNIGGFSIDLKYEIIEDKVKETLIIPQGARPLIPDLFPGGKKDIVFITEIQTTNADIKKRGNKNKQIFKTDVQVDSLVIYDLYKGEDRAFIIPLQFAYTDNDTIPMRTYTHNDGGSLLMMSGIDYDILVDTVTYKGDLIFDPTFTDGQGGDVETFKDARVIESTPTTTFDDEPSSIATNNVSSTNKIRGLFEFDISSIPADKTINTAVFTIFRANGSTGTYSSKSMIVSRITASWVESTVTWNTQPAHSTPNSDDNPGVSTPVVLDVQYDFNIITMLKTWYDGTNTNYGLKHLWNNEAYDAEQDQANFHSSNYVTDTSKRPKLVVNYFIPSVGDITTRPKGTLLHEGRGQETSAGRNKGKVLSKVKKKNGGQ